MRPEEALYEAILYSCAMNTGVQKPGQLIARRSPAIREALQRLTSDQSLNLRPDVLLRAAASGPWSDPK